MKITKLVVTDEDGKEHTYEGTGFLLPPSRVTAASTAAKPIVQRDAVMGQISWEVSK